MRLYAAWANARDVANATWADLAELEAVAERDIKAPKRQLLIQQAVSSSIHAMKARRAMREFVHV